MAVFGMLCVHVEKIDDSRCCEDGGVGFCGDAEC